MSGCKDAKVASAIHALVGTLLSFLSGAVLAQGNPNPGAALAKALLLTPGVPEYHFCSTSSKYGGTCKYKSNAFVVKVQVFGLKDLDGNTSGCIAVLPYNDLQLHTFKPAVPVTLTWTIDSTEPTARFVGAAIAFSENYGDVISDLFDNKNATIDLTGKMATIITNKGAVMKGTPIKYDHLPVVEIESTTGKKILCKGIDPIITNNSD